MQLYDLRYAKFYYHKLSKRELSELIKIRSHVIRKEEIAFKKLKEMHESITKPAMNKLINFHSIAIFDNELYGPIDMRWSATSETARIRKYFKGDLEKFNKYNKLDAIALFHYGNYRHPSIHFTFEEWLDECGISQAQGWNDLNKLLDEYKNKWFCKSIYERVLIHYETRIKNIEKIKIELGAIYNEAAKCAEECISYKDEESKYYGIHNPTKERTLLKTLENLMDNISLKHHLLELEDENRNF